MQSQTQTETSTEENRDEPPGAVYLKFDQNDEPEAYVIEGKPADEDPELAKSIIEDLETMVDRVRDPNREIICAMSSHSGKRAEINICGEFPDGFYEYYSIREGTRYEEIFFQHLTDEYTVPETATRSDLNGSDES